MYTCIFKNLNFFHHLKLDIVLAIPASNDKKNRNNSFGQGLKLLFCRCSDRVGNIARPGFSHPGKTRENPGWAIMLFLAKVGNNGQ